MKKYVETCVSMFEMWKLLSKQGYQIEPKFVEEWKRLETRKCNATMHL